MVPLSEFNDHIGTCALLGDFAVVMASSRV
jgi:hypothetical protein